jgi:hypothetical protein
VPDEEGETSIRQYKKAQGKLPRPIAAITKFAARV